MRIGLSCTTIEPAYTQGRIDGIGMYTKNLLQEYHKLQLDVRPYSFPKLKSKMKSAYPAGKLFPLSYTLSSIVSLANPFANWLYKGIQKEISFLHVTDHMVPRIKNIPVFVTLHDALMFSHPEWYQSKLRRIKNSLRKESFKWATHFITVSHSMVKELVEHLGINPNKISVVHNGISSYWHEEVSEEKKKAVLFQLNIPKKFILFTGTLQPKKNLPTLIKAYLNLPSDIRQEFPLVIAGMVGWNAMESLAAIKSLIDQNAGYWLNYVTDEQMRVLYQCANLYVLPSLHEGFGYPILEAFASKTPVITSNISALPEVAGEAAYLVNPASTEEIKNAIINVLTNSTLQQSLIEKGKKRSEEFSLEKCARETLRVYSDKT